MTKSHLLKNPWKYGKVDPNIEKTNPYLNPALAAKKAEDGNGSQNDNPNSGSIPPTHIPPIHNPNPPSPNSIIYQGDHTLMPQTNTYALGVHALQEQCQRDNNQNHPQFDLPNGRKVYRPKTFLENILLRMDDWETLENPDGSDRTLDERKRYFTTWLDSSCGIAYEKSTTNLKLRLQCPELIGIDKNFSEESLPIDYSSFINDVALDGSSQTFARDGWLALLEGKEAVYTKYLKVLKEIKGNDITPNFWKRQNCSKDNLRAVYVNNLIDLSFANGDYVLNNDGCFVQVNP